MPFLYGNHVVKAHLGRITEDTPEHQGVVVFSMNDVPLVSITWFTGMNAADYMRRKGFGVTARSTIDTRKLDPTAIIVFHQASVFAVLFAFMLTFVRFSDVGEYLRDEVCSLSVNLAVKLTFFLRTRSSKHVV